MLRMTLLSLFIILTFCAPARADELSLEDMVEKMAEEGISVSQEFVAKVRARVKEDPDAAFSLAEKKLADEATTDEERAVLVWALALTGRPEAVGMIIGQAKYGSRTILMANIDNALGELGGEEAGNFLYKELRISRTEAYKVHLITILAKIKFERALPEFVRVLEMDPLSPQGTQIHVFGMMGEKAVPYLIDHLDSSIENIRKNSVTLLGKWLMPPEAVKKLTERFYTEPDPEIRKMILDAVERIESDLDKLEKFAKDVTRREKDYVLKRAAKEILEGIPQLKAAVREKHSQRKPDAKAFKATYEELYSSRGITGSYRDLGITSSFGDEPALERLRERILSRSDSASLYDAQKVIRIILINRLIRSEGLD